MIRRLGAGMLLSSQPARCGGNPPSSVLSILLIPEIYFHLQLKFQFHAINEDRCCQPATPFNKYPQIAPTGALYIVFTSLIYKAQVH